MPASARMQVLRARIIWMLEARTWDLFPLTQMSRSEGSPEEQQGEIVRHRTARAERHDGRLNLPGPIL